MTLLRRSNVKTSNSGLRNGAGIAHDNQLMPTVGALIRRMNVLVVILHIAAARIKITAAKRNVIHQRVDFQNDGLVIPLSKRTQNQRAESLTAQVRLDAEMLDIDVGTEVPIQDESRKCARPSGTCQNDRRGRS